MSKNIKGEYIICICRLQKGRSQDEAISNSKKLSLCSNYAWLKVPVGVKISLKEFGVTLKAFLGLAMANQCCQAVMKEI